MMLRIFSEYRKLLFQKLRLSDFLQADIFNISMIVDNFRIRKGGERVNEKKNRKHTRIIVVPHYEGKEKASEILKRVITDEIRKKSEKVS